MSGFYCFAAKLTLPGRYRKTDEGEIPAKLTQTSFTKSAKNFSLLFFCLSEVRSCVDSPGQAGTEAFNRAMLFNVGFREAMKDLDWDCMVFHDVDHILENDRNYYGCGEMPRHFAVKLNKYSYM